MSAKPVSEMPYLPDESRRWGVNPATGIEEADRAIPEMCDHGAARFLDGKCDAVEFRIMPNEIEAVRRYMAENHSTVTFHLSYPRFVSRWLG